MGPLATSDDLVLPFDLRNGIEFDLADNEEREHLRIWFNRQYPANSPGLTSAEEYFERDWKYSDKNDGWGLRAEPLPEGEYRYFVLRSSSQRAHELRNAHTNLGKAGLLREPMLWPALYLSETDAHGLGGSASFYSRRSPPGDESTIRRRGADVVTGSRLEVLARDAQLLSELDPKKHERVENALRIFGDVFGIPTLHSLHTVGYFVALESLLAHKPNLTDPHDSIVRQLRRSIPLLLRRAGRLDEFEDDMKLDKLIKQLYDYRSTIAHGGSNASAAKAVFKNHDRLSDHLEVGLTSRRLVQAVLCQALREPDLCVDLSGPV